MLTGGVYIDADTQNITVEAGAELPASTTGLVRFTVGSTSETLGPFTAGTTESLTGTFAASRERLEAQVTRYPANGQNS